MKLFCFGLGYSAGHFVRHGQSFTQASGTVRTADKASELSRAGIEAFRFNGDEADPGIAAALAAADLLLVSVQPGPDGDPVLAHYAEAVAAAPRLRRIVYLSTIGVYGDHGGAWIDESTPAEPLSQRGRARLRVEADWLALGGRTGKPVAVLRLAGIYGPGRNALDDLRNGEARRIDKPNQVFNRIHVTDIGRAIDGAFGHADPHGVWNVTDDEPAPAPVVVDYAAGLLGVDPPPLIPFDQADFSPMARSFYAANRRVSNQALKTKLGVELAFPTFREGLSALWADQDGSR